MANLINKSLLLILFAYGYILSGQEIKMPLYAGAIPYSKPSAAKEIIEKTDITAFRNVSVPGIEVYLPTKKYSTGQCVIICPGGGYRQLSYDLEGTDIVAILNSIGVAAVVLKYRLPSKEYCTEPHKVPLSDAQRAMRLVRFYALEWHIDPGKIGIMGFSAGGHLASTLGTHFDYGNSSSADSVEKQSCRPDFMILMYPVISFIDTVKHSGSRKNLLGENPDKELILMYSNELQVKNDTPPAFFVHADNDEGVTVKNTLLMYKALRKKKIPAELHILSEGGHGFGLAVNNEHVASWTNSMKLWLNSLNKSQ
ncbi:MAG TPA: esterase [Prolixibacteraceae bacterium]|nr:esterase [Prolixibacteraceae bacterium]